jgi:hypothetical protein
MEGIIEEGLLDKAYVGLVITRKKGVPRPNDSDIYITPYIEMRDRIEKLEHIRECLLKISIGCMFNEEKGTLKIQGIGNCIILAPYTKFQWFKEVMELCSKDMHRTHDGMRHIMLIYPRDSKTRKKKHQVDISDVLAT